MDNNNKGWYMELGEFLFIIFVGAILGCALSFALAGIGQS